MPFVITRKSATAVLTILGSNEQLLEALEATKAQYEILEEALKTGPKEGPEFMQNKKDFNKFSIAIDRIQGRLDRLKKFNKKESEGYECFIIPSTITQIEILKFIACLDTIIDTAIKVATNPAESLFFEIIKDSAASHSEALKNNVHSPGFEVPFLKAEKVFLKNSDLPIPDIRFSWIKEDISATKISSQEKKILINLCLQIEIVFASYEKEHTEKSFSESVDKHIREAVVKVGCMRVSPEWMGIINALREFLVLQPIYTEFVKKEQFDFPTLKSSLVNIKKSFEAKEEKTTELVTEEQPSLG